MPRSAPIACAIVICAGALMLGGCGKDDSALLGSSTADALNSDFDRIGRLADDGRCADASRATRDLATRISGLPRSIDSGLRRALDNGVDHLQVLTNDPECGGKPKETQTQTETQPPPTRTVVTPPPTQPTKTQTQPPPTTEEPPTDTTQDNPDDSGGTPPDGDGDIGVQGDQ